MIPRSVTDADVEIPLRHLGQPGAVHVRISGIDCPERAQLFGTRAKELTSDLCFGKTPSWCASRAPGAKAHASWKRSRTRDSPAWVEKAGDSAANQFSQAQSCSWMSPATEPQVEAAKEVRSTAYAQSML